jgi:hypothetical protein
VRRVLARPDPKAREISATISVLGLATEEIRERSKMVDKLDDPFLNWFALGLLFFVVIALFYGIIAIHDIPARIAKARHHPHEDAIHAAGWVSLFTLHVLWPFLWIWAMAYQPERGWGFSGANAEQPINASELEDVRRRLAELEKSRTSAGG